MTTQKLPVIECPDCQEQTVLPHGNLRGISEFQWYWPMDEPTLKFACPRCGRLSVHRKDAVLREILDKSDLTLPPSVLWRVEFACDQENSGPPIVVHTKTDVDGSSREAEALARRAKPAAVVGSELPLASAAKLLSIQLVSFE